MLKFVCASFFLIIFCYFVLLIFVLQQLVEKLVTHLWQITLISIYCVVKARVRLMFTSKWSKQYSLNQGLFVRTLLWYAHITFLIIFVLFLIHACAISKALIHRLKHPRSSCKLVWDNVNQYQVKCIHQLHVLY